MKIFQFLLSTLSIAAHLRVGLAEQNFSVYNNIFLVHFFIFQIA